ncbi:DUF2057 family protein [Vibrio sp. CAU 1672]|uniref:DUF2057 family protein n=1 Tax=Vibrio sp. CAU 1672 TaxID=3032594 RepID=UPI0023DB0EBE|nr:DUF2057 family protein [Vibrio sp. CAU 1672]MDF2153003.1 DUF2057 family protein [Vibrio sp. CAU 1672]
MKIIKPLTCMLALAISGPALADVTLSIPDDVSILAANGRKAELSGGLFASSKTLTLPDGVNQVVVRYAPFFSKGNERVSTESHAIIARFTATDSELTFELPEYRDLREAEANIKQLELRLIDESGNAIDLRQEALVKPGMQIGRDYLREVEDYNRQGGVAAVTMTGTAVVQPVTLPAVAPDASVTVDSTAEEMLHFWYNKADAETRARFKAFVNQQ